jgi:potassium/chloride transporter 9
LKKGALYIIGHIIVTADFSACLYEIKKQKSAWLDFIRVSGVKAFHQVAISPSEIWGMRNLVLNAGLGGLHPNLIVMGFFSLDDWRNLHPSSRYTTDHNKHLKRSTSHNHHTVNMDLPTDDIRAERPIAITTWVNIVEDILLGLNMNIAIGKGMDELELPMRKRKRRWCFGGEYHAPTKKYIDLWPIQMSAELVDEERGRRGSRQDNTPQNLVTSNFDTYTMILQMVYPSQRLIVGIYYTLCSGVETSVPTSSYRLCRKSRRCRRGEGKSAEITRRSSYRCNCHCIMSFVNNYISPHYQ